ncbi:MAG: hypothetical protein QXV47_07300 [Fervidicoccaceae archaeon]
MSELCRASGAGANIRQKRAGGAVMRVGLDMLVAVVESRFNQFAIRFEPHLYASRPRWMEGGVRRFRVIHECSENTAWAFGATSFGMYQILGANIYGICKYDDKIFRFVGDSGVQLECFKTFVSEVCGQKYEIVEKRVLEEVDRLSRVYKEVGDFGEVVSKDSQLSVFVRRYNGAPHGSKLFDSYVRRMVLAYISFSKEADKVEEFDFGGVKGFVGVSVVGLSESDAKLLSGSSGEEVSGEEKT